MGGGTRRMKGAAHTKRTSMPPHMQDATQHAQAAGRNQRDGTQVDWTGCAPSLWCRLNAQAAGRSPHTHTHLLHRPLLPASSQLLELRLQRIDLDEALPINKTRPMPRSPPAAHSRGLLLLGDCSGITAAIHAKMTTARMTATTGVMLSSDPPTSSSSCCINEPPDLPSRLPTPSMAALPLVFRSGSRGMYAISFVLQTRASPGGFSYLLRVCECV